MAKMVMFLELFVFLTLIHNTLAASQPTESSQNDQILFQYHNGPLLMGKIPVHLIWYGKFTPSQRAIITDFVSSLSSSTSMTGQPSAATWWKGTHKYYQLLSPNSNYSPSYSSSSSSSSPCSMSMGARQVIDEGYSLGKSLTSSDIQRLAARGGQTNSINVVLTAADVDVDGFCKSRCGTHGYFSSKSNPSSRGKSTNNKFAYIWVGNSETKCPGECAWPFEQPNYGVESPPRLAPNNDVGLDGMVINLASLLAGTVTNPYGNGYFKGPKNAPLEAGSACPGVYGKGAYPGYAGALLVDQTTGASYNAYGVNGRKYLLPALFDPSTSSCSTLV